ncbi:hypothetical protein IFM47457_10190 [Aspergillus lentulus]|nr:hypothetical protein IFM47457_10190 [Aspergillus lentulus]
MQESLEDVDEEKAIRRYITQLRRHTSVRFVLWQRQYANAWHTLQCADDMYMYNHLYQRREETLADSELHCRDGEMANHQRNELEV